MMSNPWAMGLTLCSMMVMFLLLRVAVPAAIMLLKGEGGDSEFLLAVEKKEMLADTVLRLVWLYFLCSPFLLTAAAFDLAEQIPGAMCPIGTFNANVYGFPLLLVRLWGVFLVSIWLALYAMDMQTATTPFRRARRYWILFLFCWTLLDTFLQTSFFTSINPVTITSCCAVVFDPSGSFSENPVGILAKHPTKAVFFVAFAGYLCMGAGALTSGRGSYFLGYGLLSPLFFFFGLSSVISCISPYIYALPHHHCPFCILRGKEAWVGIPLMLSLYLGNISGWYAGLWQLASRSEAIKTAIKQKARVYFMISLAGNVLFFAGSLGVIIVYKFFGEFL